MPIDYSQFTYYSPDWRDLYDFNKSYPENILNLTKRILVIDDIYYPILVSYLICNSAIAKVLPILFMYGIRGTGKSLLGYWASVIHNVPIYSGADTFASLRNNLENQRYTMVDTKQKDKDNFPIFKQVEKHCLLVFDDVDEKVFNEQPNLYRMFKCGYDKVSSTISIADLAGRNQTFKTFSAKIISSIQPLHISDRLNELQRRMIVCNTKRIESFANGNKNASDLLEIKDYQWKGFEGLYDIFWSNHSLAREYLEVRSRLTKHKLPFDSNKRIISLDLMTTGIVSGLFSSINEAVEYWSRYFEHLSLKSLGQNSLKDLLVEFIDQQLHSAIATNQALGYEAVSEAIDAQTVKTQVAQWREKGWLDQQVTPNLISSSMRDLGYKLYLGKWQPI